MNELSDKIKRASPLNSAAFWEKSHSAPSPFFPPIAAQISPPLLENHPEGNCVFFLFLMGNMEKKISLGRFKACPQGWRSHPDFLTGWGKANITGKVWPGQHAWPREEGGRFPKQGKGCRSSGTSDFHHVLLGRFPFFLWWQFVKPAWI